MSRRSEIGDLIADLSPAQQEVLLRRLRQIDNSTANGERSQIPPRDPDTHLFPLSFSQERSWFFEQFEPGSPAYNLPFAIRLKGSLDFGALTSTIRTLVQRHEALRTVFSVVDGRPVQTVKPSLGVDIPYIDLRHVEPSIREEEARRVATEEALRPFNLEQGPLLRTKLLRVGDDEHLFLVNIHHIVCDHWSLVILTQEMVALYRAYQDNRPSPLPPLPIQYADFACWQRDSLSGEKLERLIFYWKKQLDGIPPLLDFPTDRPRPPVWSFKGATRALTLPSDLLSRVRALSQEEDLTLFMTLLSAFKALLYRYSQQTDVVVGIPIAGRYQREVQDVVGIFINTLVLRTDLSGNPTFRELLSRVREVVLGAYEHQELPFEKLVEVLQPERSTSYAPLFQVMFIFQEDQTRLPLLDLPDQSYEMPGATWSASRTDTQVAHYDLTLVSEDSEGRHWNLKYSTDLFDEATIDQILSRFQMLLRAAVRNPDTRIKSLPLVSRSERQQLLVEWNATSSEFPAGRCIHELFEEQATLCPDAPAITCGDDKITYGELDRRADQLAAHLRDLEVGPESLIGICVGRSLNLIVGILGILKAGAAYVPLDPNYPWERMRFVLENAELDILLANDSSLPQYDGAIVRLGDDCSVRSGVLEDGSAPDLSCRNLAYVIYTSGSTGKPKGVLVEHLSLVNYSVAASRAYALHTGDRVLQFASICFDTSAEEIFSCLISGATLVLLTSDMLESTGRFLQMCRERAITVLNLPTAFWHEMIANMDREDLILPETVRLVIIGGEQALPEYLSTWHKVVKHKARLVNTYGPTETTIVATMHDLTSRGGRADRLQRIPIGRPVANTHVYILDSQLEPVPPGIRGEIYLGGICLARGYLGRPRLTSEFFIPNGFSRAPGQRIYRTGDLGRYLPDATIEFLGRTDRQIKLRGFRIELGEIESTLQQHPDINQAVAVAWKNTNEKRLIAYVVPQEQAVLQTGDLRRFVKRRLPDYMQPSGFVFLDSLPVTAGGKIDHSRLPRAGTLRPDGSERYAEPRTTMERTIAETWSQVLSIEQIGIHDSFFDLGGHSLQALQLVSRLSVALNVEISVRLLFVHPTVASLAKAVEDLVAGQAIRQDLSWRLSGDTLSETSLGDQHTKPTQPHLRIERRSLASLVQSGEIAPVSGVALDYLPASVLNIIDSTRDEIVGDWLGDRAVLYCIRDTTLGRVGHLLLPRFSTDLYTDMDDLTAAIVTALEDAGSLGAQVVSLTGLIPSATRYGQAVAKATAGRDLPRITTGHATTTAAVVLTIKRILEESARALSQERVGFLGLGSIGVASLQLMLSHLPHPREIVLCDVFSKGFELESIGRKLAEESGYEGSIRILQSDPDPPLDFYETTLVVGAANVQDIYCIDRAKPGTLIVDDSAPHCFDVSAAVARFQTRNDILFTEGGVLQSAAPIEDLVYLPKQVERATKLVYSDVFAGHKPCMITGCVFSSLLSARFEHLEPTLGLVRVESSRRHLAVLSDLGLKAADLHCSGYVLPSRGIKDFRLRYGL